MSTFYDFNHMDNPYFGHLGQLDDWMTVIDSSAAFKSLFNVTTFIKETQVLIYDKFNFIINPQSIYKYEQLLSDLVYW